MVSYSILYCIIFYIIFIILYHSTLYHSTLYMLYFLVQAVLMEVDGALRLDSAAKPVMSEDSAARPSHATKAHGAANAEHHVT